MGKSLEDAYFLVQKLLNKVICNSLQLISRSLHFPLQN